jgi:hypothetical protein
VCGADLMPWLVSETCRVADLKLRTTNLVGITTMLSCLVQVSGRLIHRCRKRLGTTLGCESATSIAMLYECFVAR